MYCAMRDIRLVEIEASCWKGQSFVIRFDGRVCTVSGRNGIGKTCIYMSYLWLLTGYTDSINGRNHLLYDCSCVVDENTPMASVRGVFEVDGGVVELYRGARPRYVRNKMDGTYRRMSSDEYVYKVNGVSMSVSEYNDYITSMAGPLSLLPYALNGERFMALFQKSKSAVIDMLTELSGVDMTSAVVTDDESAIKADIKRCGESIIGINAVISELKDMLTAMDDGRETSHDDDAISQVREELSSLICEAEIRLSEKARMSSQREQLRRERSDMEAELSCSSLLSDKDREYIKERINELDCADGRLSMDISAVTLDDMSERLRVGIDNICALAASAKVSDMCSALNERINVLRGELRGISEEWAKKRGVLDAIKSSHFEACKSVIGTINGYLSECRVTLMSTQKSGESKPDCGIETLDGVMYATANNSQRARMCVDIQRMIMRRMGCIMPVFVDEANKFNRDNIPPCDGQEILIYVSESPSLAVDTIEPW